ncbi:uncharacterized protein LOC134209171 [Armigeres subalbatus]|uniref:uncharacterized protein LOC134209171 n=1 Tax=Armigeres subalbatus TaxID=124917 RepID=UPI002ED57DF8
MVDQGRDIHLERVIAIKYGSHEREVLRSFQKVSIKLAKTNNRVKFLLNCRKCKVIPVCLNYKVHVNLENEESHRQMEKVLFKQKIRILSILIADAKRSLSRSKKVKAELGSKMDRLLQKEDFEQVRKMVENKAVNVYVATREIEMKKIEKLKRRRVVNLSYEPSWVENTTSSPIPDFLERTLMLGPNYNVPNRENFPYIEIVADIDKAIKYKEEVEEIRAEVVTAMSNFINFNKQPRHHHQEWIAKDVGRSRKFLKENPNLLITKADKGTKTVILSKWRKCYKTPAYEKISFYPKARVSRKIKLILDGWKENKYIESKIHRRLNVSNCNLPRIYGLPKIHKEGRPLRPVVSTIGSTTYRLAQYLSNILGKVVGKTDSHVINSFTFATEVSGTQIDEDEVMFSLDVTSLYTNVPVDYAIECINQRWGEIEDHTPIDQHSFVAAVQLVLESTLFVYGGVFYKQTFGVPMGSPLSPVVANLVMERLEQESIRTLQAKEIVMKLYRRYVDDCFCIAKTQHIDTIINTFNEFHEKLNFTIEKEKEHKLKFLDMTLDRTSQHIKKIWTPKQTNGRYLDFHSDSPFQHKRNTAMALIDRAIKLTDATERHNTITTCMQFPAVQVTTKSTWDKQAVCWKHESMNRTSIRKREAKTGLAQHYMTEGHNFDFGNTEILERIENQESTIIAEAFHIKMMGNDATVNLQRECGGIDSAYNTLVCKIRSLHKRTATR